MSKKAKELENELEPLTEKTESTIEPKPIHTKIVVIGSNKEQEEILLKKYAEAGYKNVEFVLFTGLAGKDTETLIELNKRQKGVVIYTYAAVEVLPEELHNDLILATKEFDAVGVMSQGRNNALTYKEYAIEGKKLRIAYYPALGISEYIALNAEKYSNATVKDKYVMNPFLQLTLLNHDAKNGFLFYGKKISGVKELTGECKTCGK